MKIITENLPDLRVLEAYAKSIGYAFITYHDKLKTIAHYKNFGCLKN